MPNDEEEDEDQEEEESEPSREPEMPGIIQDENKYALLLAVLVIVLGVFWVAGAMRGCKQKPEGEMRYAHNIRPPIMVMAYKKSDLRDLRPQQPGILVDCTDCEREPVCVSSPRSDGDGFEWQTLKGAACE